MGKSAKAVSIAADRANIIKLAIIAIGGQGGGVLSDWIVQLAEANGWYAQSTSVPGVAQRTGATIYYIEMVAETARAPVLALMPTPGDVDIVIAAELMEAGRAIQRGLVTPDRTVLIASTHRALAVGEKMVPGNGIGDPQIVLDACAGAASRLIIHDMESLAKHEGSVISASLFGALSASEALPFPREQFEASIKAGGRGIEPSMRAFGRGFDAVMTGTKDQIQNTSADDAISLALPRPMGGTSAQLQHWAQLVEFIQHDLPAPTRSMALAGLAKVVEFQDCAYGDEYLGLIRSVLAVDRAAQGEADQFLLTTEAAKHLANAMAYDDLPHVADRKTRQARMSRIASEVSLKQGQVIQVTEYFHPRMEEVCGLLPLRIGRAIQSNSKLFSRLNSFVDRGRRVRSDGILWFTVLYLLAGLRRIRRGTLRHDLEVKHRESWLAEALRVAPHNYPLAVEVIRTRRLIKGYSDTHARGTSKFDRVISAIPILENRADGGEWLRRLREAALRDEEGTMLDGALKTVATL